MTPDEYATIQRQEEAMIERVNLLFFAKLLQQYPNHPWRNRAPIPPWEEPRRVDVWWWMDLNIWSAPGILWRCGRVSWNQDGTGYYEIDISDEHAGIGLPCWPSFRSLSAAQDRIEQLIWLPIGELEALNGTEWRVVK